MVRQGRALSRLLMIAALTGAHFLVLVGGVSVLRLLRRNPLAWKARRLGSWSRAVSRAMGMRLRVDGGPPQSPFLLVANHLSYVDVLLLAGRVQGVFVARGDLAGWPLLGVLTRSVGTIYLDRSSKRDIPRVAEQVRAVLAQGLGVTFFPEGTSTDGGAVLPFKPALLETAARLNLPVSYASLSYATGPECPPARLAVCWWGDMTFSDHLWDLLSLPGFEARISFGEQPLLDPDRKQLAATLREAVQRRLEPATS
jgi:1-acyl-sn-glycerol-3-phosphate acyltransferase